MSFSMPALIGALMLMGIVTKSSILLIERAVDNEATRGMDPIAALSLVFVSAFSLLLDKAGRKRGSARIHQT